MSNFDIILHPWHPSPHTEPSDFVSEDTGIVICTNHEMTLC